MLPIQWIAAELRARFHEKNRIQIELDEEVSFRLTLRAKMYNQSREELAETIVAAAMLDSEEDDLVLTWQQLTEREQQVAALACLGLTYKEIAQCLLIARTTVQTHLGHIYQKMGVEGKQHLRNMLSHWDFSSYKKPCK